MEADTTNVNPISSMVTRLSPAVGPMLLISMGYIDPGKWSAVIEGGARFGHDLVLLTFVFNIAAILCQYLAARIGVVTGKNLAQICGEEYNKHTCIFLGVQAELSVIVLDLTMILGTAHGLNLLFGLNLSTCLLFTATDAVLFPLLSTLLGKYKANVAFVSTAGFVLALYVFGVLIGQPETSLVMSGTFTRLSGESAFTLMSLLGASIMPHNFYVHSSIVQEQQGPADVSKKALCHDHFCAILCVFSGVYLVNYVLMNSAATVFHSAGLVVLTFQDILLLMDQVMRSSTALFVFFLVLFISSHISALTWNIGGQVVLHELFKLHPPVWLHRASIRILVVLLALYSTWNSGAERIYQLLVFTQVVQAMLLPSSVIPLFRVASSRSIMGVFKISPFVEFLALITLLGMLGLNIIFVVDMLFGQSDWVGNLRWNGGSLPLLPYVVVLVTACVSLVLMIWLAATPLISATLRVDTQIWNWESQSTLPESYFEGEEEDTRNIRYHEEKPITDEPARERSVDSPSGNSVVEFEFNLPESIMDPNQEPHRLVGEENVATGRKSSACDLEAMASTVETAPSGIVDKEVASTGLLDIHTLQKTESVGLVEKSGGVEGDSQVEKDDYDGDMWEPEESSRETSEPTSTSEGPGSFRSLSGKTDEGGSGNGSLSRLCGLGRAARRQLAAILDEFWGQLYDFHGQATQEAKAKKLDSLVGLDPKQIDSSLKGNHAGTGSSGYFPSVAERGSALLINPSTYDSPKQQLMSSNVESPYGFQTGSSPWSSSHMQYLNGYMQSSTRNVLDSSERRYSSLRLPPSSEAWDYQPATVHGYQLASYLNRATTDRTPDSMNTLLDSPTHKSHCSPSFNPASYRDPLTYALGQNSPSQISAVTAVHTSGTHNPVISRISRLQTERSFNDPSLLVSSENVDSPAYTKKYHSLPDISGLAVQHKEAYLADRSSKWNGPPGFGPAVNRTSYGQSPQSNSGSRPKTPLSFDQLSPSKLNNNAFSLRSNLSSDAKSLWTRQPYEQLFGVAGETHRTGDGVGSKPSLGLPDSTSCLDSETELLQSFRGCIMKILKLEGCDWLFRLNGRADEDLIDQVAASERFRYEAENREINRVVQSGDTPYISSDRKYGSASKNQEAGLAKFPVSSVSHCGDGCIWQMDLIVSFGVWCIHRILELSLMESRPELWGKYTYVLNRLQGILDPAFFKPRSPSSPCFCLQIPANAKRSIPSVVNGSLPPAAKPARGKCTSASNVLELIKDVEMAVSCRKGRTGTAAGDVAFPKGKENLASVLKRYKRRLSNKPVGTQDGGSISRKVSIPTSYIS